MAWKHEPYFNFLINIRKGGQLRLNHYIFSVNRGPRPQWYQTNNFACESCKMHCHSFSEPYFWVSCPVRIITCSMMKYVQRKYLTGPFFLLYCLLKVSKPDRCTGHHLYTSIGGPRGTRLCIYSSGTRPNCLTAESFSHLLPFCPIVSKQSFKCLSTASTRTSSGLTT